MELSGTSYVILGTLRLGLRTGYEIKQLVDKSTRHFWAASYGQIYPELKKLEEAGLVRGEPDPQGGRRRRAYSLTPAGERALDEWVATPDVSVAEIRDLALLKLFFADDASPHEAAALARAASERHAAVVAALEEVERMGPEGTRAVVLGFGLDFHRWCSRRFAQMEEELKED